ncbi:MAG: AAA family ATPase [Polyangiaceae bacterium]|nr:AAA family ATPase [Polyangiaceae bacterium]
MLRTIHIRGFKSAVDVSLELGRLNVLIGPNGAGKTNLLEAVSLLGCAASGRVDHDGFRARGVRPGTPALYRTALASEKGSPRPISLAATSGAATYRVSLAGPAKEKGARWGDAMSWRFAEETFLEGEVVVASRAGRKGQIRIPGEKDRRVTPEVDRGIAPLIGMSRGEGEIPALLRWLDAFAIYTPLTPMLRALLPDPVQKSPVGLMGGGLAEGLFSLQRARAGGAALGARLQRELASLIDWLDSISFGTSSLRISKPARDRTGELQPHLTLRLRDHYLSSAASWLSASEANEGALHVLCLLTLLFHPGAPRVLAVDNVDHALNPQLARYLIERVQQILLEEPDRPQLLLTAHNPLVLDALALADDRVRLFVAQRDRRTGAMQVRRFLHTEVQEHADKQKLPLSRLWVTGALGGVPHL